MLIYNQNRKKIRVHYSLYDNTISDLLKAESSQLKTSQLVKTTYYIQTRIPHTVLSCETLFFL